MIVQNGKQKADILRLRLSLAAYKIQTGQTDVPLEQLEMRSLLLPLGGYHHSQGRLADGGASPEAAVDRYHDGSNSNPANWSFISNSSTNSNSNSQGHGYFQRVNHLRHAAGAAIEAVQAKQEHRTAWREREQYREWYEQYGHHYQISTWENAAAEQDHDGLSRDQSRQRQRRQQQQQQQQRNLGSGSKSLPSDQGDRVSGPCTTFTGSGTSVITTAAMTTTTMTSPHLTRLDLAERALQAHQRLQSRAVTEELLMDHEHEHEHDEIDSEPNYQQLTHHHQPQQQQRHRHHLDKAHEGWVVRPAPENGPEVANDIAAGPGRRDRSDDDEEEESIQAKSRSHQVVGPSPSYSTEPELEPELPCLMPYQLDAGEKEEQDGVGNGDGDEAASGLLSLSRG